MQSKIPNLEQKQSKYSYKIAITTYSNCLSVIFNIITKPMSELKQKVIDLNGFDILIKVSEHFENISEFRLKSYMCIGNIFVDKVSFFVVFFIVYLFIRCNVISSNLNLFFVVYFVMFKDHQGNNAMNVHFGVFFTLHIFQILYFFLIDLEIDNLILNLLMYFFYLVVTVDIYLWNVLT